MRGHELRDGALGIEAQSHHVGFVPNGFNGIRYHDEATDPLHIGVDTRDEQIAVPETKSGQFAFIKLRAPAQRPVKSRAFDGGHPSNKRPATDHVSRLVETIRWPIRNDLLKGDELPLLGHLPDLGRLEPRVPPRQAAREQLGHHGLLHDLELVDDRLRGLDGVVHGGEDGSDLPLFAKGRHGNRNLRRELSGSGCGSDPRLRVKRLQGDGHLAASGRSGGGTMCIGDARLARKHGETMRRDHADLVRRGHRNRALPCEDDVEDEAVRRDGEHPLVAKDGALHGLLVKDALAVGADADSGTSHGPWINGVGLAIDDIAQVHRSPASRKWTEY